MTDEQWTPQPDKASIGDLVGRAIEQVQGLVRGEIALAKAEAAEKGKAYGVGGGMIAAAAFLGLYIFGILLAAAILGLANVMPAWAAALVVAAVLIVIAAILVAMGAASIKKVKSLEPQKIGERLKEDVDAVKAGLAARTPVTEPEPAPVPNFAPPTTEGTQP